MAAEPAREYIPAIRPPVRKGYWANMTAEQRSTEMKRRRAISKKKSKAKAKKNEYSCKHCGETFKTRYQLANHVRYKHPRTKGGASDNGSAQEEHQEDHSHHISFLAGSLAKEITNYAASSGVPRAILAEGVRGLLQ